MGLVELSPAALAEMIGLIEKTTISGKIGKQILPDLLKARSSGLNAWQRLCADVVRVAAWCSIGIAGVDACADSHCVTHISSVLFVP